MSKVVYLNEANFDAEVLNSAKLTVVDFWAEWCGPCRTVGPVLDALSEELADTVKIAKLNVDEQGELAEKYQIRSIPTMLFFKEGKIVDTSIGALPKAALKARIEKNI